MRVDPKDANVLMRIGDLHLKSGAAPKAAEVYATVSRELAQAGFEAKAVAVAKQVLRIDPDRVEIRVELGELYQRMGLASDAVREFQAALEIYRTRGAKTQVYDLLKRAASLDPENIPSRLSLADLMIHEGLEEEARAEFDRLLSDTEAAGAEDALERVATATLEHFPDHPIAQRRLGEAKLKAGATEEAVTLLSAAAEGLPGDLELRQALAEAFEVLGDDEASQRFWSEVAGIYRERGDEDASRDIMQRRVSVATIGAPTRIVQELEIQAGESQPEMELDLENPEGPKVLETLSIDGDTGYGLELELDDPAGPETRDAHTPLAPQSSRAVPADVLEPDFEPDTDSSLLLEDVVSEQEAIDLELAVGGLTEADSQDAEALLAEARVSLEYEQFEVAADRARAVLQRDPASDAAREILSQVLSLQGETRGAIALEQERRLQARAEGNASRVAEIDQRIELLEQAAPDAQIPSIEIQGNLETASAASPSGPASKELPAYTGGGTDEAANGELPLVEAFEILESEAHSEAGGADELVLNTPIDLADDTESDATPTQATTGSAVEAVFAAFKQGIQSQLGDDESGAHYDLAIAYREMGLLDDAVQELEVARRGKACRLEALSLLATCKVELGRPADAVDHLEEALALAKEDPVALTALRYDLGEALCACDRQREGLLAFRTVAAADADFREVATRIRELESLGR